MQPLRAITSYYTLETRGSMRKPQRILVINLSVSFPFFFHWTNAVMPEHTTDICYWRPQVPLRTAIIF